MLKLLSAPLCTFETYIMESKHHLAKVYVYRGSILLRCGHGAVCGRGIYLKFKSFLECRECTHTHMAHHWLHYMCGVRLF